MPGPWALAMADLASDLQSLHLDPSETVDAITADIVRTIPGVVAACLVTMDHGVLLCQAPTAPLARSSVAIENRTNQGPCWDALKSADQGPVLAGDLASHGRAWRDYQMVALSAGIAGVVALPLIVDAKVLGVLALFAARSGVFTPDLVQGIGLYMIHASVALAYSHESANLRGAVQSRDIIGQAKGILMERFKLTDRQAFALLVTASQKSNTPLRQVAEELALTGHIRG